MESGEFGLVALPALSDNYIWALRHENNVLLVDPGEAAPALEFLERDEHALCAILLTHKHQDHIGGVAGLLAAHPHAAVIAPAAEGNELATRTVNHGDNVQPDGWPASFAVYTTPGHTAGHVSYVGDNVLLCGDALFSCGCGRLFEGDASDLAASMAVFNGLPDDLRVCCGHEYTVANIAFARAVEPDNADLAAWEATASGMRADCRPTLPVTLGHERLVNPFLRADVPAVRAAAAAHAEEELASAQDVLGALRTWKDNF